MKYRALCDCEGLRPGCGYAMETGVYAGGGGRLIFK